MKNIGYRTTYQEKKETTKKKSQHSEVTVPYYSHIVVSMQYSAGVE